MQVKIEVFVPHYEFDDADEVQVDVDQRRDEAQIYMHVKVFETQEVVNPSREHVIDIPATEGFDVFLAVRRLILSSKNKNSDSSLINCNNQSELLDSSASAAVVAGESSQYGGSVSLMFLPFPMLNPIYLIAYQLSLCTIFQALLVECLQLGEKLLKKLPSFEGVTPAEVRDFIDSQHLYTDIRSGDVHNTIKVIEGEFLDLLAQVERKQQWAIGPILPTKQNHISNRNNICLEWLNKQPPRSVLYISFGTTSSFSDGEIKEFAMGLEQSKQKFIWVLRDAGRGDIFTGEARRIELPEGFEVRNGHHNQKSWLILPQAGS
ncbi:hypothetical protein K7X08_022226 [Anisodus acutangulus]|uniref:Glycosyltransferase N-terminal domain-containing protein n=1 Tax=Anisodus acutangulus TaxID=402998 RepID=A0A9Q1L5J7_9SOLA|nr:hypothetical protein K7X08_022226 [Anisodus acutangulus]